MAEINCLHFHGGKPCGKARDCHSLCEHRELVKTRILIIHLGALGAVVRSTALLPLIHSKYPQSQITWITDRPGDQLLLKNPLIHRVLTTETRDLLKISSLSFDVAFVLDKSLEAAGILKWTEAQKVFGFIVDGTTGSIVPATEAAQFLWQVGLNDELKFKINQRTELDLMIEALELNSEKVPQTYFLPLDEQEKKIVDERRQLWSHQGTKKILGLNTGCSSVLPAKKLSVQNHRELISHLSENSKIQIVLLGGPEDSLRNREIARGFEILIESPTENGLRDGTISIAACDLVFSGDSLGMHLAISQNVEVLAWFGPTCAHEIEFFGRGEAVQSPAPCGPCWKRTCQQPLMCYDQLDLRFIAQRLQGKLFSWTRQAPHTTATASTETPPPQSLNI